MANSKSTKKKTSTSSSKKTTTTKKVTTKKPTTAKKTTTTKKVEVKPIETKKFEKTKAVKKVSILDWCKENYTIIGLVVLAILLIINIVIVSIGHQVKLADGKEIVASIDGKDFVADELFDKLKEASGSDTLLNMIDEYIISKEITDDEKVAAKEKAQEQIDSIKEQYTSMGYEWETVLNQYGYDNEEVLLNEMLLSVEKETIAKNYIKKDITDEEVQKYYDENVFGKYTAKHILITPETNDEMTDEEKAAAEDAAKAKAQEVIEKLNNGEDWNSLVTEYSEDTGSKGNEGLVENFTKEDVVEEFWNAVEKLEDGKYTTEPVKSSYGYHIIYRVSYTEKESLDSMKDELVDEIVTNKLNEDTNLYTTTWVNIRKKYNLVINDTKIKTKYEQKINESE